MDFKGTLSKVGDTYRVEIEIPAQTLATEAHSLGAEQMRVQASEAARLAGQPQLAVAILSLPL